MTEQPKNHEPVKCYQCDGIGITEDSNPCPICDGTGKIPYDF